MRHLLFTGMVALISAVCVAAGPAGVRADDAVEFTVAEGKMAFKAPASWTKKMPRTRIVEIEYEIPAAKDDAAPGRLTVMGAGGTVEANIDRWVGQFTQTDGAETKAKIEKQKLAGCDIHIVDLAGTYLDKPAPFANAKAVPREGYRQLAAIVESKKVGNYFLKFYGPAATVAENEKAFRDLIGSLSVKE